MVKLLIGGSPCTHWSIAQSKNRETTAEGVGWELFRNYVIAKEKFKPDFFLYENNWSASKEIKAQIQEELGCKLMRINSRLVSAQNRDRFYVFNWDVEQPEDRRILLRDILETGVSLTERETFYMLREIHDGRNQNDFGYHHDATQEKSKCLTANTAKGVPYNVICEPVRIGTIENSAKNQTQHDSKKYRVYSPDGKSVTICGEGGGVGAKTGLYAVPHDVAEPVGKTTGLKSQTIYRVENGRIELKGESYHIKLQDGYYIIRKLTPVECERLQTLPDGYTSAVSNTQRYKGLGNGWTAEIIIHILQGALKDIPRDEKIIVLSMYDGIATGRYCLDKMGFTNVEYHAYEIDKYAMKIAMSNYPDIIQHGDAFQVRNDDWSLGNH